ncbi:hypothetical protein [Botrimarina hoheduenensis]|uniref:Zinc-finger domain-containing protein n=1 Tax=Botrimarina hoheduenensis TaxID=2528000 RepID=A0A5C5VRM9_9BACT|nr:hypothetical protein [Botrimarina hoheduenensis]TWT40827.1 hypothetical protein Pla111_32450 [Botrimarina hoheduenensis]
MSTNQDWSTCEPGELQALRSRLVRSERNQRVVRAAGIVSTAAALIAIALVVPRQFQQPAPIAQITCQVAVERFDDYGKYLSQGTPLPSQQADEMRQHLTKCDRCRSQFDEKFPGLLTATVAALLPLVWLTKLRA